MEKVPREILDMIVDELDMSSAMPLALTSKNLLAILHRPPDFMSRLTRMRLVSWIRLLRLR